MKIYFGHPKNTYSTPLEQLLLEKIARAFPGFEIENPNQQKHQDRCEAYRIKTGNPMDYFTEEVLPSCQRGIFLPFRDGMWGAGVYVEGKFYFDRGLPVYEISPDARITSLDFRNVKSLSVPDTIARIRTPEKVTIPY